MKTRYPFFLFAWLFLLGVVQNCKAQTAENWQPVTLNTDGSNNVNGVEAYCRLSTCNDNDVILLRFVNHTAYAMKANWKDLVITTIGEQHFRQGEADSLTIGPNSVIAGDCPAATIQLVIKLTDFGILKEDFKEFIPSQFNFVNIH